MIYTTEACRGPTWTDLGMGLVSEVVTPSESQQY